MVAHFERVHPGLLLADEIEAREMSANKLAIALRVSPNRITRVINGERPISPELALRLGRYLGTGPDLWMRMQAGYDLWKAEQELGEKIAKEVEQAA
jgi:addiction module HigA family antidote